MVVVVAGGGGGGDGAAAAAAAEELLFAESFAGAARCCWGGYWGMAHCIMAVCWRKSAAPRADALMVDECWDGGPTTNAARNGVLRV